MVHAQPGADGGHCPDERWMISRVAWMRSALVQPSSRRVAGARLPGRFACPAVGRRPAGGWARRRRPPRGGGSAKWCPYGCEGRGDGGGVQRVPAFEVLGVEMDVLGAGGDGRAGFCCRLLGGQGEPSASGAASGTVQTHLEHGVISSGGYGVDAALRQGPRGHRQRLEVGPRANGTTCGAGRQGALLPMGASGSPAGSGSGTDGAQQRAMHQGGEAHVPLRPHIVLAMPSAPRVPVCRWRGCGGSPWRGVRFGGRWRRPPPTWRPRCGASGTRQLPDDLSALLDDHRTDQHHRSGIGESTVQR